MGEGKSWSLKLNALVSGPTPCEIPEETEYIGASIVTPILVFGGFLIMIIVYNGHKILNPKP